MQQLKKTVDWYDEVCQRLEMLHVECHKTKDCEDEPPPDFLFEIAKKTVENLRPLIGFIANLPVADVWLGPEGEIGLTWEFDDEKNVDFIFTRHCENQGLIEVSTANCQTHRVPMSVAFIDDRSYQSSSSVCLRPPGVDDGQTRRFKRGCIARGDDETMCAGDASDISVCRCHGATGGPSAGA